MSATFTPGKKTMAEPAVEVEVDSREAAIASLRRKRKFLDDLVAYVAVNGVLWLIWALSGHPVDGSLPWPAWVSIIWGFLLAIDAWKAFGRWPGGLHRPISDDEIDRELRRMQGR